MYATHLHELPSTSSTFTVWKVRLIQLWLSVDNRHGCFSLQYSAHLACLSVLTRQVKCTPTAFLTSLPLFFTLSSSLSSAVRARARHPSIDHSFRRSASVVGGRLGSAWWDTPVKLEETVKGWLTHQAVSWPGKIIIAGHKNKEE